MSSNLLIGKRVRITRDVTPKNNMTEGLIVDCFGGAGEYHYGYCLMVLGDNGEIQRWVYDSCTVIADEDTGGPYR